MLVLSRKQGASCVLPGHGVSVTVVSVHGNTVRLGFVAPESVKILRKELVEKEMLKKSGEPLDKLPESVRV